MNINPKDQVCFSGGGIVLFWSFVRKREEEFSKYKSGIITKNSQIFCFLLFQEEVEVLFKKRKKMLSQIGHKLPQMTFLMHIPTFFHLSLSSLQSSLSPCLLLRGSFFSPPPPPSLSIFINSSFGVFCSRRPKTSPDCFQEDHSGCPRRSRKMLMTQNVILIRSGREKKTC